MKGKYMSLTTFKRDGTAVATTVWFVQGEDGRLFVSTDPGSGKVKRIANNPAVTIAQCTASGRVRGELLRARAEVVPDGQTERLERMMQEKYRLDRLLILPVYRALRTLRGKGSREPGSTFLAITPSRAGAS